MVRGTVRVDIVANDHLGRLLISTGILQNCLEVFAWQNMYNTTILGLIGRARAQVPRWEEKEALSLGVRGNNYSVLLPRL